MSSIPHFEPQTLRIFLPHSLPPLLAPLSCFRQLNLGQEPVLIFIHFLLQEATFPLHPSCLTLHMSSFHVPLSPSTALPFIAYILALTLFFLARTGLCVSQKRSEDADPSCPGRGGSFHCVKLERESWSPVSSLRTAVHRAPHVTSTQGDIRPGDRVLLPAHCPLAHQAVPRSWWPARGPGASSGSSRRPWVESLQKAPHSLLDPTSSRTAAARMLGAGHARGGRVIRTWSNWEEDFYHWHC